MKKFSHGMLIAFFSTFALNSIAQDRQVALVTFYSDKKIGGTGLGNQAESLINDPSFNLQKLVDKSYDRFVNEFAKDFPFKLIDNAEIVGNEEYKKYKTRFVADTSKTLSKFGGVQFVSTHGLILAYGGMQGLIREEDRDPCNLAKIFPEADGILFVVMDYEFESRMMGVAAGIRAYLNIYLYDKNCEKVFRIREAGGSKGKVPAVAGIPVMDPKKIQPLCEDATEVLFEDLKGRLGKIVKKSANF